MSNVIGTFIYNIENLI